MAEVVKEWVGAPVTETTFPVFCAQVVSLVIALGIFWFLLGLTLVLPSLPICMRKVLWYNLANPGFRALKLLSRWVEGLSAKEGNLR